jgi:hypothetical protein
MVNRKESGGPVVPLRAQQPYFIDLLQRAYDDRVGGSWREITSKIVITGQLLQTDYRKGDQVPGTVVLDGLEARAAQNQLFRRVLLRSLCLCVVWNC